MEVRRDEMADLEVHVGGLRLKNPVLTASGTCGYGMELLPQCPPERLGGVCTKGLSLEPRIGSPAPRIWEVPCGMLNAIGLANVGIDVFIEEKLPPLRARGVTVIANVLGVSPEEFGELSRRLDVEGVAALELNLSCPNVKAGGVQMSRDPDLALAAVEAARGATSLPLIAKLSPEGDTLAIARAVARGGVDAFSVCNTLRAMAIDIETRRPRLGGIYGGMSGPALHPVAVRLVHEVAALGLPVIGVGGVTTWVDAVEMMLAGASAVQVGTALFADPSSPVSILEGVETYLDKRGETARQIIGAVEISG
jgi:dihydroorotate dehydrogenase (NAD+) catalytic subunit